MTYERPAIAVLGDAACIIQTAKHDMGEIPVTLGTRSDELDD